MAPRILRDLPLEVLVEGFLAADKVSAIVLRAEQFNTGRRRLRRAATRFLVAPRGGPQSIVEASLSANRLILRRKAIFPSTPNPTT
jgi:hypothetical protein